MTVKHRSPNYPGVDLENVIENVKKLYPKVRKGEFTVEDATAAWGYSSANGPARVRFAALRQFGMLDGRKGEHPKLSRLAFTFAIRNNSSREYQEALQEAAGRPPLFARALESKPNASDSVLREWLLMDENFSDDGASRFVEVFRNTMRLVGHDEDEGFAEFQEDDYSNENDNDGLTPSPRASQRESHLSHPPPIAPNSGEATRVPLRLMGGTLTVVVELPDSMTEKAWQQMITMLAALKPGYVADPEDESSNVVDESDGQPEELRLDRGSLVSASEDLGSHTSAF